MPGKQALSAAVEPADGNGFGVLLTDQLARHVVGDVEGLHLRNVRQAPQQMVRADRRVIVVKEGPSPDEGEGVVGPEPEGADSRHFRPGLHTTAHHLHEG
ncbi:hypothetical protein JCM9957A_57920 [Kineosporia succinea]